MSLNRSLNEGRLQPDDHADDVTGNAAVRKFLDLSTSHITRETALELMTFPGIIASEYGEYGWWVWVPEDVDEHLEHEREEIADAGVEIGDELVNILEYARRHDCDYVLLDRDGPHNPDLSSFDW